MGLGIFLALFLLGILLSTIGGLIGIVDAFKVSPVWGLLSLFIPFALLVFCIKFWGRRKWARTSLITSLAGLAAMFLGLPYLRNFANQQMAGRDEFGEPIPAEQVPLDQIPILPTEEEVFAEPLVPAAPQLVAIGRADLIQSTDPDERLQQINSSRPDPFATVPIPPPPQVAPPPPPGTVTVGPGAPGATPTPAPPGPGTPPVTTTPPGAQPGTPQPGVGPGTTQPGAQPGTPQPGVGPGPGVALAPLPVLPQPTQAQAVVVTGVVTVGNQNYAIVQSPDEPTGRYVAAGQRVAGGQVLVKRIDMRGSEPVVVLEQNGIEISRSVGLPEPEPNAAAT
jgi:hypothetical protein